DEQKEVTIIVEAKETPSLTFENIIGDNPALSANKRYKLIASTFDNGGSWSVEIVNEWNYTPVKQVEDTFTRADSQNLGTTEAGNKNWQTTTGVGHKIQTNKVVAKAANKQITGFV